MIEENRVVVLGQPKPTYYTGIEINGTTLPQVKKNSVEGDASNSGYPTQSVGYAFNQTPNAVIECNGALSIENGFTFNQECLGTDFKGNGMNAYLIGLSLSSNAVLGSQVHRGNSWNVGTNNNNHIDATHASSQASAWAESTFLVACPDDPTNQFSSAWCPDEVALGGVINPNYEPWFSELEWAENTFDCGKFEPLNGNFRISNLEQNLASGNFQSNTIQDWILQRQLYDNLRRDIYNITDNEVLFDQFITDKEGTPLAHEYMMNNIIANKHNANFNNLLKLIYDSENKIKEILQKVVKIQEQLQSLETSDEDYILFLERKKQYLSQIKQEHLKLNELSIENKTNFNIALTEAKHSLEQLTANTIFEKNLKTVYQLYFKVMKEGFFNLNDDEIVSLSEIANQCPSEGGDAVYKARSLYSFVEDKNYHDACNAPNIQERLSDEEVKEKSILVFPNPATNIVNITYQSNESAQWILYNNLGVEIHRLNLVEGESTYSVNADKLLSGLYTWQVQKADNRIESGKILIIK